MKPNKFSKLTQQSLTLTAQIVLIVIAVATIFAIAQEIGHVWEAGSIAVGDLLMLFLYLEVISMLNHYLGSGNLPVRYPLYIGII
jgi:protein PsiE